MPISKEQTEARSERIVDVAAEMIARGGLSSLTARAIAERAQCSPGLIYRNFGDLDGLILRANSRFIERLDAALADVSEKSKDKHGGISTVAEIEDRYCALALTYLRFAQEHKRSWMALFEHRMPDGKPLPEWHLLEHLNMFRHIAEPLKQIYPQAGEAELYSMARTIYSAVHGIVSISTENRLGKVPALELERQLVRFVRIMVRGLAQESA